MWRLVWVSGLCAAMLLFAGGAAADTLVYDGGPASVLDTFWTITGPFQVSDPFSITSSTDLTMAQVALSDFVGNTITGVGWSIGTTPFGSQLTSGTAIVNDTPTSFDEVVFPISGSLSPGTYWLTLLNATATTTIPGVNAVVLWGESLTGAFNSEENDFPGLIPSESFQLYGVSGSPVPEPATVMLFSVGILGLGVFCSVRGRARYNGPKKFAATR